MRRPVCEFPDPNRPPGYELATVPYTVSGRYPAPGGGAFTVTCEKSVFLGRAIGRSRYSTALLSILTSSPSRTRSVYSPPHPGCRS